MEIKILQENTLLNRRNGLYIIISNNGPFIVYLPLPNGGSRLRFKKFDDSVYQISIRGILADAYDTIVLLSGDIILESNDKFWFISGDGLSK